MVSNKWLIENLDAEIAKFDESAYVLPSHQLKALETCLNLITEDPDKAAQFSKPRRNAREHARTALKDIFSGVAPEVFLLCSLSTSISRLAKVAQTSLVPDLRKWWKTTSCPQGLVDSARLLCENYSIPELVGGMKKRPEEVPEPTSISHRRSTVVQEKSHSTELPIFASSNLLASQEELSRRPPDQPVESVFVFTNIELITFYRKIVDDGRILQMPCQWTGSPRPTIEFDFEPQVGLKGKFVLSTELSAAFMKDVWASRNALKVANRGLTI